MKGKRQQILKGVVEIHPTYALRGCYLFRKEFQHVIVGFCLEAVPSGYYLWEFALPLYDGSVEPHLTFGKRVGTDGGFLSSELYGGKAIIDHIVHYVETYDGDLTKLSEPAGFLDEVSGEVDGNRNVYEVFAEICSLVLIGRLPEAGLKLESLMLSNRAKGYTELSERLFELVVALNDSPSAATRLLKGWEDAARAGWTNATARESGT